MNLILFDDDEIGHELPRTDPRAVHIRDILKLNTGDDFAAGIIGGPIGRGYLAAERTAGWQWDFTVLSDSPPPLKPLTLILGCPRPPVARRLLKDMSTIGIREIRACTTDLNEKSYLASRLWREGLWRDAIIEGAMQGVSTLIPVVQTGGSLEMILEDLPSSAVKIALDNGSGVPGFATLKHSFPEAVLAVGPERGWSDRERGILDSRGFLRLNLGRRILRTETACSVGATLLLDRMDSFI